MRRASEWSDAAQIYDEEKEVTKYVAGQRLRRISSGRFTMLSVDELRALRNESITTNKLHLQLNQSPKGVLPTHSTLVASMHPPMRLSDQLDTYLTLLPLPPVPIYRRARLRCIKFSLTRLR
ncbi:hypothetical protein GYMLUDRAFT_49265 [Collybiopsis luxurians FD-317 M1]|uniref:Uncharacterized protein n=1 Tax=Collybiopsis luxurians FD-317 M1 TaxID=944289 RepID=A0A0D0C736_9AGAR|nr:hypothetical protein GYMLUDRAFT_49265 [Collybiopsis luxurians FD-317 M1]